MSRVYSVQFSAVAVTAQQDLFAIVAAAGKNCRILACFITQSTEAGDAEDEMLTIRIRAGNTTVGSGGGAYTPVPTNVTDAAAGFTARINDTTIASAGTAVIHHSENFNVRSGFMYIPTERMQIELTGSRRLVVGLTKTPADSVTMSGTLYVEEFG